VKISLAVCVSVFCYSVRRLLKHSISSKPIRQSSVTGITFTWNWDSKSQNRLLQLKGLGSTSCCTPWNAVEQFTAEVMGWKMNTFASVWKRRRNTIHTILPIPVAALSRACVFGRSLCMTVGSNPAGGMDVSWKCCVLSGRWLCVGLISRPEGIYRVWYVWMWSWSLASEEVLVHQGLLYRK
jgi:hypothetical protein